MRIGQFLVLPGTVPGKVWLEIAGDGEGGDFSEAELDAALLAFYTERF
jgi:hypothetical protein